MGGGVLGKGNGVVKGCTGQLGLLGHRPHYGLHSQLSRNPSECSHQGGGRTPGLRFEKIPLASAL